MDKRVREIAMLGLVLFLALAIRMYYIQIMCGDELSEGAVSQQVIKVKSEEDRGVIYDRNLIKLTNSTPNYYYLIHRTKCGSQLQEVMKSVGGVVAGSKGNDYVVYKAAEFDSEMNKRLIDEFNAYAFCANARYDDEQTAAHLIGYVSDADNRGEAGLEKLYQARLSMKKEMFMLGGNGAGEPIKGIGISQDKTTESLTPSALVTTVDSPLQKKVEEILQRKAIYGAVVILERETGQILAMASSPAFNPNQIESYLDSQGSELINKAIQGQYPPGSVFKIAVAAAALESGQDAEQVIFKCTGSVTVNGVKLSCEEKPEGHGELNMEEAFAVSCNCYFAKLAEEIGSEPIIDMAENLGLGNDVLEGFPGEESGHLPDESERSYSGLSNLAIGQGSLLVTPIQMAKMTNIIANRGIDTEVSVVMRKQHKETAQIISPKTADEIKVMMQKVMTEGTASGSETNTKTAGKTGSAESSDQAGLTVHGWFVGFFPADNPKYTVAVFAENGKTGSGSALPVFDDIVNHLY